MNTKVDEYFEALMQYKHQVKTPCIRNYLDVIFDNPTIQQQLKKAPASVDSYGAYQGGLIKHIYQALVTAMGILHRKGDMCKGQGINKDIVIAGVLVRDLGKCYAYEAHGRRARITRSGCLLGHLAISHGLSVQSFIHAESVSQHAIDDDIKDHIHHCILSQQEPKSIEAWVVCLAYTVDNTLGALEKTIQDRYGANDENGFIRGNKWASQIYTGHRI